MMEDENPLQANEKWLHEPLSVSCDTCRFELPINANSLSNMTMQDYLSTHCVLSARRVHLYRYFFKKYDKNRDGVLSMEEACNALHGIYSYSETEKCVEILTRALEEERKEKNMDSIKVHVELFEGLAALTERLIFHHQNPRMHRTGGIADRVQSELEQSDFHSIKTRLHGVTISKYLQMIFHWLTNSSIT